MSLKIFLNQMCVRPVNAPRKKMRQYIFLFPVFIYMENTRICCI